LPRKHEQDHAFLQPFHRLGFFSILRSVLSIAHVLPAQSVYELRAACARARHGAVSTTTNYFTTFCVFPRFTIRPDGRYIIRYEYIFPRFTIRPDGRYIIRYECVRACCAFIAAVVFPAYGYLVLQWPGLYYVALLLDLSAYFDIFQRMLVGYFNEQGILIYHPASTAAHYMKGAFITDLFGCVALESLETAQEES
ncbi:putative voltage and ligand gated potassium channel, partial [Operophtera brumata]